MLTAKLVYRTLATEPTPPAGGAVTSAIHCPLLVSHVLAPLVTRCTRAVHARCPSAVTSVTGRPLDASAGLEPTTTKLLPALVNANLKPNAYCRYVAPPLGSNVLAVPTGTRLSSDPSCTCPPADAPGTTTAALSAAATPVWLVDALPAHTNSRQTLAGGLKLYQPAVLGRMMLGALSAPAARVMPVSAGVVLMVAQGVSAEKQNSDDVASPSLAYVVVVAGQAVHGGLGVATVPPADQKPRAHGAHAIVPLLPYPGLQGGATHFAGPSAPVALVLVPGGQATHSAWGAVALPPRE